MAKQAEEFNCLICDFVCCKQSNYNLHISTQKHKNRTNLNNLEQLKDTVYECIMCDFKSSKQCNYKAHLLTSKHIKEKKKSDIVLENKFSCKVCNKIYKARNSLWYHEKKCIDDKNKKNDKNDKEEDVSLKKLILEIIKNNTELQKQNSELQKQLLDVCKNSNNTINSNNINSNNKTFNLQFFLNEQCKDAMNISDFVNSFDLQLDDLESVGTLGYVEGITKQFLDKLNGMDIYKRPMHCSDAKRETIYIKDENKWEKEERGTPKLRKAIKTVSFNNLKLVVNWTDTYPESKNIESRLNDKYLKLVKQTTGGNGELSDNEDKIIRRIAKEIIIDKV